MPELDGLRAVAIVGVLAAHLWAPAFLLGAGGVNLFFVISGFLITGILLNTRLRPAYFKNFYVRRALRIFPIYYLMLAAVSLWGLWAHSALADFPFYLVYLQNVSLAFSSLRPQFPHFFSHTWSLAIEEQFYLLWPFAAWRLKPRQLGVVAVLSLPIALVYRFVAFSLTQNPVLTTWLLPSQLEALGLGALLAITFRERNRLSSLWARAAPFIALSAMAMIIAIVWRTGYEHYLAGDYYFYGRINFALFTLFALCFASLISIAVCFDSPLARALCWPPFIHIGRISYGLYLYHYPLFFVVERLQTLGVFAGAGIPEAGWSILKVLLSYGVAFLSWRYVESPLLRLKERLAPKRPQAALDRNESVITVHERGDAVA